MIIQLFGRGVRLKGKDFSLKRSSEPDGVRLLETLDIFGMKADYMAQFKDHLEREGVDPDGYEELPTLPIRKNEDFLNRGLLIPHPPEEEFAERQQIALDVEPDLRVSLDLSVRLETARMGDDGLDTRAMRAGQEQRIGPKYLSMLDWTSIYLDLLEFKNLKKFWNLIIPFDAPRRIMEQEEPVYSLVADSSVAEPQSFDGLKRLQEIVQTILRKYLGERADGSASGREVFLLRNLSRGKGVGFFNTAGFYPDFILWVKYVDGSQKVVFVEPHGMRNDNPPPNNDKVNLYLALRDLSDRIKERDGLSGVFLDSYIVSATPFRELSKKWGEGWRRERFAKKHILFEDDLDVWIPDLLAPRDELERRISTSYPYPLAHGYRALMGMGDPEHLYREQLRFAENILAFVALVSLALLGEEDREKAGLDLKRYWSGGISPGDWKEIIQRCSKVFAGYDIPLAVAIHG